MTARRSRRVKRRRPQPSTPSRPIKPRLPIASFCQTSRQLASHLHSRSGSGRMKTATPSVAPATAHCPWTLADRHRGSPLLRVIKPATRAGATRPEVFPMGIEPPVQEQSLIQAEENVIAPQHSRDEIADVPGPHPFPIVGVGASAGGLEAFRQLLGNLPADTGMAFVLVQHLDPKHESRLAELLGRATPMPVHEARHGQAVRQNHVYIIAPNTNLAIAQGLLHVTARGRHAVASFTGRLSLSIAGRGTTGPVDRGCAFRNGRRRDAGTVRNQGGGGYHLRPG